MKIMLGLGGGLVLLAAAVIFGLRSGGVPESQARGRDTPPVLVELFTSQGCSSCPPADRVLAALDASGEAIAVSRPVTYWDRLGWTDTLARPANDRLQERYKVRAIPGGGLYTPEGVVGGAAAAVGSHAAELRQLIAERRKATTMTLGQQGSEIVASAARGNVELHFLALKHKASIAVAKGENGGRELGYTNVVLAEATAPCDPSLACRAPIPSAIARKAGADRWVAVLQDRDGGTVRAVRWIRPAAKSPLPI